MDGENVPAGGQRMAVACHVKWTTWPKGQSAQVRKEE